MAQFEYVLQWSSLPEASLFATGYFDTRITGGLRIYFGPELDKSRIRRHREDDPKTYDPVFPKLEVGVPSVLMPRILQASIFSAVIGDSPKRKWAFCTDCDMI